MNEKEIIINEIQESVRVKEGLSKTDYELIVKISRIIAKTLEKNGTIFFFGNGGSAADAQHIAAEFVGRFQKERKPLSAEALTTNTSILTAGGNDYDVLRIGPVFGADKRCSSIINDLITHILNKQDFKIWGDGKRKLQPTDVEDVSAGCLLSINSSKEIYNIISPERYSIQQIAEILKEQYGLSYSFDSSKPSGQIYPHISSEKAEKMLNWNKTPFSTSIKLIIESQ